ncbi:MAG TPA: FHA domain-containing protein [Phycisphaerales bacterium]|nr:FHA domain-containing protein [Phycisphaerales bacterium]
MATLTVLTGALREKSFELASQRGKTFVIGRGCEGVEMRIPDNAISRRHAELSFRDGQWFIRDLGSSNGTFINELRVQHTTGLSHNDQIRCGATVLLFEADYQERLLTPEQDPNAPVELVFDPGETMIAVAFDSLQSKQAARHRKRILEAGQAALNMSHGVKNILQALRSGQDVMDDAFGYHDMDQAKKAWNILKRNLDKIHKVVLDMLKFSRETPPRMQPCQFNRLVESVAEVLRPQADLRHVSLTIQLDEQLEQVNLDPDQMQDVLMNLVMNAIEAVEPQVGQVTVHTELNHKTGELVLRVTDNGRGIENTDLIFEPFHTDKQGQGTGLGLAIARKIVRNHHGRIEVKTLPGEGSIFTVRIPVRS